MLDNPTSFSNPFQFEITFEAISELTEDLEWKVTYVGSAEDSSLDQVLDEVAVGPIPVGVNKFVLQADAPDVSFTQVAVGVAHSCGLDNTGGIHCWGADDEGQSSPP